MRYLSVPELLTIYAEISSVSPIDRRDVQNISGLESALAQPQQTFEARDMMYGVARGDIPTEKVEAWISQRIHPYDPN